MAKRELKGIVCSLNFDFTAFIHWPWEVWASQLLKIVTVPRKVLEESRFAPGEGLNPVLRGGSWRTGFICLVVP